MRLRHSLSVLSLLTLCACSTTPHVAPSEIPKVPVGLASPCTVPDSLAGSVTAQDLIGWTMEWINAFACERSKRSALVEAWPR